MSTRTLVKSIGLFAGNAGVRLGQKLVDSRCRLRLGLGREHREETRRFRLGLGGLLLLRQELSRVEDFLGLIPAARGLLRYG